MAQEQRQWTGVPIPLIDPLRCDGCGLCVQVCPTGTLGRDENSGRAIVVRPEACDYTGHCETICPTAAIARPFEVVVASAPAKPT
jgi:ferredoxin